MFAPLTIVKFPAVSQLAMVSAKQALDVVPKATRQAAAIKTFDFIIHDPATFKGRDCRLIAGVASPERVTRHGSLSALQSACRNRKEACWLA